MERWCGCAGVMYNPENNLNSCFLQRVDLLSLCNYTHVSLTKVDGNCGFLRGFLRSGESVLYWHVIPCAVCLLSEQVEAT